MVHAKLYLLNENSTYIVYLKALILCIKTSVDVPVFVVAPEIMVQQKTTHIHTPRNWAMEIQQLPYHNSHLDQYLSSDFTNDIIMA